ncbi:MAG TPA: aldehyde dehydrogenase family protein [Novosphingobium sp.]|jgi:aldehyde dehydrogenase (NAD+)|nr:aldehyde dehydrogenase family protein [Novosphingobium sp.]HOA48395.1 aldehyde dehydrogenase family protein [Novosphingobium sp.]HPB22577.1 aldehyde dehydrogenase family protein [Novosphingobium sp.]HPZ46587.1 aldehyde dehydrogenase family protein [Novosphingobium sp.]HQD99482.1 aldehyde dehydrogenase family protein [Novosphingobium sp.]
MRERLQHYIDGKWVDSEGGARREVINPATEEPCAVISIGTKADVDKAVAAARRAFKTWSKTTREERLAVLNRIVEEYKKRAGDLAVAMAEEMGAPVSFAGTAQVGAGIGGFLGTIAALKDFNFLEDGPGYKVAYEPIGVVGMITPWNWPLNQIALKVAPALAAGDTMVLKPSEECPTNAAIFAEILDAAGVPPGVFNLVQGDGPTTGNAISSHPDVEMVSFTGSTRAGIAVAIAAAPTVKRVHQELGGKSPNLVLPDADFAATLPSTLSGPLVNTGQSCISPTKVLVPRERLAEAEQFAGAMYAATPVGDPMAEGQHLGPLVNKAQFDKVRGLIQSAIDEGAKLVTGGPDLPKGVNRGYYIQPTVFSNVTPDMRIAKEEIFGPVVTLIAYDTLDQAIDMANDTEYGLSAAISGDPAKAAPVAAQLRAGMVAINNWGPTPGAPFGGYKQSGNGREGGLAGLKDFMEMKAISGLPA